MEDSCLHILGKVETGTKGRIKLRCLWNNALWGRKQQLSFSVSGLLGWFLEAGYAVRTKPLWDTFLSPPHTWIYKRFPSKSWRCTLSSGRHSKCSTQEGKELPKVPSRSVVAGSASCVSAPHHPPWRVQGHLRHLAGRGDWIPAVTDVSRGKGRSNRGDWGGFRPSASGISTHVLLWELVPGREVLVAPAPRNTTCSMHAPLYT